MYTGIVTHRGKVRRVERRGEVGVVRLVVDVAPPLPDVALGESIAVDGVCLTVAGLDGASPCFDVVPETLRRTTLGDLAAGSVVNLERPLRVGDEVGGHLVQGHVEGTGAIAAVERRGDDVRFAIRVGPDLHGAAIPKGSVAIDGVSLTVGEVWQEPSDGGGGRFSVYLIPHTLAATGLASKKVGDRVNVEPDLLGRWVEHHVRRLLGPAARA